MARKKRITHRSLRMALDDEGGNITNVATALMVSRKTVYEALARFPDLREGLDALRLRERKKLFEIASTNLLQALLNQEKWATLFALNRYDDLAEGEAGGGLGLSPDVLAMLQDMGQIPFDPVAGGDVFDVQLRSRVQRFFFECGV